MVQFPRLDPLANASPYERLLKLPVKSFSLSAAQYDRVRARRPELIVDEDEAAVIGVPARDYLEIHYAFPDPPMFHDRFGDLFDRVVAASSKLEAPRGLRLPFRDRPNRSRANTVFWPLALDEGPQWVEMSRVAIPEQPEPGDSLAEGHRVREAGDADRDAVAELEGAASGQPRLSEAAVALLFEDSRWIRVVEDRQGVPVAFVALRTETSGWGIVDLVAIREDSVEALRQPVHDWCVAFLRNNGGRRVRRSVYMDDAPTLALLRAADFAPGETGLDFTRAVDPAELRAKLDERRSHGTVIRFGGFWR